MSVMRVGRNLMAGVRAADADQQVIFRGEVIGDVALALTAVLAPDQDIHQLLVTAREQAQRSCSADLDVFLVTVIGVDINVRVGGKFVHLAFRPVLGDFGVTRELSEPAGLTSPLVPLVKHRPGSADVNVIDPAKFRSESLDLAQPPDRIHKDEVKGVLAADDDRADRPRYPGPPGFPVQPVAIVLQ